MYVYIYIYIHNIFIYTYIHTCKPAISVSLAETPAFDMSVPVSLCTAAFCACNAAIVPALALCVVMVSGPSTDMTCMYVCMYVSYVCMCVCMYVCM